MRTMGFLLVVVGGLLAYLGLQGKVGQAITALKTGSAPLNIPNTGTALDVRKGPVPQPTDSAPAGSFHLATSGGFTITPPIPPQGNGW